MSILPSMIGEEIKRVRLEQEMSQNELAIKSGLKQQEISFIEKGRIPTKDRLERIAKALGKEWKLQ